MDTKMLHHSDLGDVSVDGPLGSPVFSQDILFSMLRVYIDPPMSADLLHLSKPKSVQNRFKPSTLVHAYTTYAAIL